MSEITIRAASPAHKNKKAKTPPKKLWMKASHSVQDLSHWKNSESTTRAFTAKACKFIYIQALLGSPQSVKQVQTDSGKYDEINVQHFGTHFVP